MKKVLKVLIIATMEIFAIVLVLQTKVHMLYILDFNF